MAASIAKLAIQLITDTSKMVMGFRTAQNEVKKFGKQTKDATSSDLTGSMVSANLQTKLLTDSLKLLAQAGQTWFNEGRRMQEQLAQLSGDTSTFNSELQSLRDRIGINAIGMAELGEAGARGIGKFADKIQKLLGFTPTGAIQDELRTAAEEGKRLDEQLKAANERAREWQRAFEGRKRAAADLTASLRTPVEIMRDEIERARALLKEGLITAQAFRRATDEAGRRFADATKAANQFKAGVRPNVGALERGSSAEVSGRIQAQFAAVEAQRQIVAELKLNRQVDQEILRAIRKQEPVQLQKGRF